MTKFGKGLTIIFATAAIGAAGYGVYTAKHALESPPPAACTAQCADVNAALSDLQNAGNDKNKQQVALQKLSTALPVYGAPAMAEAQKKLDAYKAAHGGKVPASVLEIYGAKTLSPKR